MPGYQAANWWGIAVPAGTPKPIVERLNKELNAVLASDEVKKIFDAGRGGGAYERRRIRQVLRR